MESSSNPQRSFTQTQDRFCWFSLDVNGFRMPRPWITNSGTELECAFLHKQWETHSMSSDWMPGDPLYAFRWRKNTCRRGYTLPVLTSGGLFVTGRPCYSPMSQGSVSILLIDVSWCGECLKRELMNWIWQNMAVKERSQSRFGQELASRKNWLVRYWKRNIDCIEVLQ